MRRAAPWRTSRTVRVLFDQGTPVPLRDALQGHAVETAYERGWATLQNGELLAAAERDGFDLLVTTDRNLKYQQSLAGRRVGVVVLGTTSWPRFRAALPRVRQAVDACQSGGCVELSFS